MRRLPALPSSLLIGLMTLTFVPQAGSSPRAHLQSTAILQGRVVDQNGAVVRHAKISAHNNATAIARAGESDSEGNYQIAALTVGNYPLDVRAQQLSAVGLVTFSEPTLWEQYKWRIVGVITLCILQGILIVLLLISRSRHRQAEQENERLARVAEAERRRLDEVVSNVPGVVWESRLEPGTKVRKTDFVSDYVEKMLGYRLEEWYTPGFAMTLVPEEDRERLLRDTEAIF
jgi:PAS domain-containing protein